MSIEFYLNSESINMIDSLANRQDNHIDEFSMSKFRGLDKIEIYLDQKLIGWVKFRIWSKSSKDASYWCGYCIVPDDWCRAYSADRSPSLYNDIYELQEITYCNKNVIGWDHCHLRDIDNYTNLNKVVREVVDTHNHCQKYRLPENETSMLAYESDDDF